LKNQPHLRAEVAFDDVLKSEEDGLVVQTPAALEIGLNVGDARRILFMMRNFVAVTEQNGVELHVEALEEDLLLNQVKWVEVNLPLLPCLSNVLYLVNEERLQ